MPSPKERSSPVSSTTPGTSVGNAGSSWVSTVNGVARRGKLAQHRLDHHAGRAVALDDGDEAVGMLGIGQGGRELTIAP